MYYITIDFLYSFDISYKIQYEWIEWDFYKLEFSFMNDMSQSYYSLVIFNDL